MVVEDAMSAQFAANITALTKPEVRGLAAHISFGAALRPFGADHR